MKIGIVGMDLPEGKVKYHDHIVAELETKFQPKKTSFFFAEFVKDKIAECDAIAVLKPAALDLFILDMEKLEQRRDRAETEAEKAVMARALALLEQETPLCDGVFDEAEDSMIRAVSPLSVKPTVLFDETPGTDTVIKAALDKAGLSFFYTAGKPEVRSWLIRKGADIVTCAGKIHTDLARGFIRADIVKFKDLMTAHNLADAKAKGLVKTVERTYLIEEEDVIEIKFSV